MNYYMANFTSSIDFLADKVYVHRWPQDSAAWGSSIQKKIDRELNKNPEKKKVLVSEKKIRIDDYEFLKLKKIGITVPLFKKETTMVFEGNLQDLNAHTHVTVISPDYLEIFNKLMAWKIQFFPD